MIGLLLWLMLRPLFEPLARLAARLLAGALLVIVGELLLERYVDPELPRAMAAALSLLVLAAGLFLRASWRRRSLPRFEPGERGSPVTIELRREPLAPTAPESDARGLLSAHSLEPGGPGRISRR